jgi:hypothetical protein
MITPAGVMPKGAVPWFPGKPVPARGIERGQGAVASTQEAVINVKAVVEGSRDRVRRGNTGGERPYTARGIGRRIECGDGAVGRTKTRKLPPKGFPAMG